MLLFVYSDNLLLKDEIPCEVRITEEMNSLKTSESLKSKLTFLNTSISIETIRRRSTSGMMTLTIRNVCF